MCAALQGLGLCPRDFQELVTRCLGTRHRSSGGLEAGEYGFVSGPCHFLTGL
jgi:hypothetical protein